MNKKNLLNQAKIQKPNQELILDEGFMMCASDLGCESKNCKGTKLDCQWMAFFSLVEAFRRKYQLVVDENYQIKKFYSHKARQNKISSDIAKILFKWLDGRGAKVRAYRLPPLPQRIKDKCPTVTKSEKLDMILCQLASASKAPIWTVDSDFDCVYAIEPDIKPLDPVDVYSMMFPNDPKPERGE